MNISRWRGLKQLFQDHKVSNMGFKPKQSSFIAYAHIRIATEKHFVLK